MSNKIACFKNYACLSLIDSFTVIGTNNYGQENKYSYSTWNDIYFSILIFNLYVKCSIQLLSNDFSNETKDPKNKRNESGIAPAGRASGDSRERATIIIRGREKFEV